MGEGFSVLPRPKWEGEEAFDRGNSLLFTTEVARGRAAVNGSVSGLDVLHPNLRRLVLCPGRDSSRLGIGVWHCRRRACRVPGRAAQQEEVYLSRATLLQS